MLFHWKLLQFIAVHVHACTYGSRSRVYLRTYTWAYAKWVDDTSVVTGSIETSAKLIAGSLITRLNLIARNDGVYNGGCINSASEDLNSLNSIKNCVNKRLFWSNYIEDN